MRLGTQLLESREMAGVVDAADGGELVVMPLDLVDSRGAEVHPVEGGERGVKGPHSRISIGVMWPTTRTVWPRWSRMSRSQAWWTRRAVSANLSPPGGACCGPSLLDFCQGEAFPFAEVGFTQVIIAGGGQAQFGGCDGCGGDGAPQR
jgi:hypothetical protein